MWNKMIEYKRWRNFARFHKEDCLFVCLFLLEKFKYVFSCWWIELIVLQFDGLTNEKYFSYKLNRKQDQFASQKVSSNVWKQIWR